MQQRHHDQLMDELFEHLSEEERREQEANRLSEAQQRALAARTPEEIRALARRLALGE